MTQRAFISLLMLQAGAVALSATSFPGSLIGFLVAISLTFFVGVPGSIVGKALNDAGVPLTGKQAAWLLAGLYALLIPTAAFQAWRQFRHRDLDAARASALRATVLLALPLMGWLSLQSMMHNWH
jgi:hypothetical protein